MAWSARYLNLQFCSHEHEQVLSMPKISHELRFIYDLENAEKEAEGHKFKFFQDGIKNILDWLYIIANINDIGHTTNFNLHVKKPLKKLLSAEAGIYDQFRPKKEAVKLTMEERKEQLVKFLNS
jgi:hypothetical protein